MKINILFSLVLISITAAFETVQAAPLVNLYDFSLKDVTRMQNQTIVPEKKISGGWYSGDAKYARTRKTILKAHQVAGLTTWALWLATNLEGEELMDNHHPDMKTEANLLYLSNPSANLPMYLALQTANPLALALSSDPNYFASNLPLYYMIYQSKQHDPSRHESLAMATGAMYALTASLALLAPSKYREAGRKKGFDSVFMHKGLALIHLASMITLFSLAESAEHSESGARQMRAVGWGGFAVLTLAIGTFYF